MFNRNFKAINNIRKLSTNVTSNSEIYITLSSPNSQLIRSTGTKITKATLYRSDNLFRYGCIDSYTFNTNSHNDSSFNINSVTSDGAHEKCSISFGSGNTPPTINDVNLESEYKYATNLRQTEISYSKTFDIDTETAKTTIKGLYVAITDMSISELGITSCVRISNGNDVRILVSRDVLPEPLVVTAGQAFSLSLTIEEKLEDLGEEVTSVSAEIE